MSRPQGAKDKQRRARCLPEQGYLLCCPVCELSKVYFRRGEFICYTCKRTFPAEAAKRVGKLPEAFK